MLRALVVLLLLANAVFFAWARGWLGAPPHHAEREPARLLAQVRPDVLTVLPAGTAGAAVLAARDAALQCLEAGPFAEATLSAAEAALGAALLPAGSWARVDPASAASAPSAAPVWWVYAGRYPEAALRKAREEELRKLNLSFERIDSPTELAPGLVLSRHASRDEAQAWLNARSAVPLRGARVLQLPPAVAAWRLRVARADAEQAERLKALPGERLAGGFRPCAAKP